MYFPRNPGVGIQENIPFFLSRVEPTGNGAVDATRIN